MDRKLVVLIATGAIKYRDLFPRSEYEDIIVEFSRYQAREPKLWNHPASTSYREIVVCDSHVVTSLTQRRVANYLRNEYGLCGEMRLAASVASTLGWKFQDYVILDNQLVKKSEASQPSDLSDRYLIILVGPMCSGRDLLRAVFWQLPESGIEVYRTPDIVYEMVQHEYGAVTIPNIRSLQTDVLSRDRVAVARHLLESSCRDPSQVTKRFILYDGAQSREEIVYLSFVLRRPAIVISTYRNMYEMIGEAISLQWIDSPDAWYDEDEARERNGAKRLELFADFRVNAIDTSRANTQTARYLRSNLTSAFESGVIEVLGWIDAATTEEAAQYLEEGAVFLDDIDFSKLHLTKNTYCYNYAIRH